MDGNWFLTISQYSATVSMPMECRRMRFATINVVPEPIKGSRTVSYSFVNKRINHSGNSSGKAALWFLLLHSVARCRTFVGYAMSLESQLEMFFPKPLPTFELSRILSVSERFLSLELAQSPIGTMTSS